MDGWLTEMLCKVLHQCSKIDLIFTSVNDSIHNQEYVCEVVKIGDLLATQNFTIHDINGEIAWYLLLYPASDAYPVLAFFNPHRFYHSKCEQIRAEMHYSITSTVSKRNDGLVNYPTATWTFEGATITSGNGITVSKTSPNTSTLIFDPLRTSHAGSYYTVKTD